MSDDERQAISSLQRGDIQGLEALVRLHQLRAIRTAYVLTRDLEAAEDAVADAFLATYDHIAQFDERRAFLPWFYRIVVNSALKARRRDQRTESLEHNFEALSRYPDRLSSPETAAVEHETRSTVLEALGSLPPKQRAPIVLRYYLGMDERTIAKTLECPIGTVKWRLHAAKDRLRRRLAEEEGGTWEPRLKGEIP